MKLNVTVDQQKYEVEVVDPHARPIVVLVDGECIEVWPEEIEPAASPAQPVSARSTPSPRPTSADDGSNVVLAPLPGVIVAISVSAGDAVTRGQELCIIEAMKMKNVIRATRAGIIGSVRVALTQHVKHHDVLMDYAA